MLGLVISCSEIEKIYQSKECYRSICTDSIASKSVASYIASNSMVMQAKYIVGPRSMSKSNMQEEDIFWNSIPDIRAQAAGSSSLLRAESIWAINLCFFVKGRIQF